MANDNPSKESSLPPDNPCDNPNDNLQIYRLCFNADIRKTQKNCQPTGMQDVTSKLTSSRGPANISLHVSSGSRVVQFSAQFTHRLSDWAANHVDEKLEDKIRNLGMGWLHLQGRLP